MLNSGGSALSGTAGSIVAAAAPIEAAVAGSAFPGKGTLHMMLPGTRNLMKIGSKKKGHGLRFSFLMKLIRLFQDKGIELYSPMGKPLTREQQIQMVLQG